MNGIELNGDMNGTYHYENSDSEVDLDLLREINGRGAPSADTKKRQAQEDTVRSRIAQARQHGSIILELNHLGIEKILEELLELTNLEVTVVSIISELHQPNIIGRSLQNRAFLAVNQLVHAIFLSV